ncbi:hypothetical protein JAAARDRAFT_588706 [Jaapia argillacea MUCL 33604]|uniref:Uncharacterized protein n=1 Tax=Jaapia argillacea MUCL 33604 TaxID=933084 RepID=A0A067P5P6_9AGAM|nr:hypothetical protein JAAARDRAFT_588706 [Jaapia argillacea MUCL 33604]
MRTRISSWSLGLADGPAGAFICEANMHVTWASRSTTTSSFESHPPTKGFQESTISFLSVTCFDFDSTVTTNSR